MSKLKLQKKHLNAKAAFLIIAAFTAIVIGTWQAYLYESQYNVVNRVLSLSSETKQRLYAFLEHRADSNVSSSANLKKMRESLREAGVILINADVNNLKLLSRVSTSIEFGHQIIKKNGVTLAKRNTLNVMFSSAYFWLFITGVLLAFGALMLKAKNSLLSKTTRNDLNQWAEHVIEKDDTATVSTNSAIGKAIFIIQDKLVKAQEAESDFDQQLRNRTLLDAVTGIGNRQYFNNCLEAFLLEEEAQGAVFLIQLQDADLITGLYGEEALDKLLKSITDTIEHRISSVGYSIFARQSEFEFSVLLPQLLSKEAAKLAARLLDNLNNLPLPVGINSEQFFHIGVNCFNAPQDSYQVMAEADMALRTAQLQGPSQWFMFESGEVGQQIAKGSLKWRTFLENVAKHQKFVLFFQPLVSLKKNEIIHHEILAKVRDEDGQLISARIFLPMARKAGVSVEVDKAILLQTSKLIKQQLKHSKQPESEASSKQRFSSQEVEKASHEIRSLNLSVESMLSAEFNQFFFSMIEQDSRLVDFLSLEISEYQLVSHLNELTLFLSELKQRNVMLVIDKVGQYVVSAKYLDSYPFYGIKLHRSIVSNVHQKNENQLVIRSLKVLCDSKGIEVFAHGVESAKELTTLADLGVTAGQGHFFTPPKQDA